MLRRIVIAQYERGLYIRNRSVERVLTPGVYWIVDPRVSVVVEDTRQAEVTNPLVDALVDENATLCVGIFRVVNLSETEVGLVRERGNLVRVLPSGMRYVFWAHYPELEIEVVDTRENYRVAADIARLHNQNAYTPGRSVSTSSPSTQSSPTLWLAISAGVTRETVAPSTLRRVRTRATSAATR